MLQLRMRDHAAVSGRYFLGVSVAMLRLSKQQMGLFQNTKQDKHCRDIAAELSEFKAPGVDDATFEAWVRRRIKAHTTKAKIVQKRHIHLLCFREASLAPDRFGDLRTGGLENALTAKESEKVRMDRAMNDEDADLLERREVIASDTSSKLPNRPRCAPARN